MKTAIIVLVFSLVGYVKCTNKSENPTSSSSETCMATYGVWLIGITMLFMLFAIIYLVYALLKVKSHQYKVMTDSSQIKVQIDKSNHNTYSRQESMERPVIPCQTIITPPHDDILVENDCYDNNTRTSMHAEELNEMSTPRPEDYRSRILKKHITSQFLLPEDKMREICIGVLKNRKSIKELNELNSLIEKRQSGGKKGLSREKSASTPLLDLTYDSISTPPPGSSNNISNCNAGENEKRDSGKRDSEKANSLKNTTLQENLFAHTKNDDKFGSDENLDDIYDCPPLPKEISDSEDGNDLEDEIYDCPPVPKEVSNSGDENEHDDDIYDCPPPPIEMPKNNGNVGFCDQNEIYDCPPVTPPTKTTKNCIVEDTDYLLVLNPNEDCLPEPSYINANKNAHNVI